MTEILFLTHNRREFTEESLRSLLLHTNWDRVHKLWLFDDRSTDGTLEFLREVRGNLPSNLLSEIVRGSWNSPVDAMADFFGRVTAPFCAKIDSDVMLPAGWLTDCLGVMEAHPSLDLLGIEARGQSSAEAAPTGVPRSLDPSVWIGGIGVFRTDAIKKRPPLNCDRRQGKWFGWQGWQEHNGLNTAWLKPSLQVFLLDRMPMEPWRSMSDRYVAKGWQRPAPYRYGPEWAGLWEWVSGVCA